MKFCEMPYCRPDIEELKGKIGALKEKIEKAEKVEEIV